MIELFNLVLLGNDRLSKQILCYYTFFEMVISPDDTILDILIQIAAGTFNTNIIVSSVQCFLLDCKSMNKRDQPITILHSNIFF